jgi:hypothetical protein
MTHPSFLLLEQSLINSTTAMLSGLAANLLRAIRRLLNLRARKSPAGSAAAMLRTECKSMRINALRH